MTGIVAMVTTDIIEVATKNTINVVITATLPDTLVMVIAAIHSTMKVNTQLGCTGHMDFLSIIGIDGGLGDLMPILQLGRSGRLED